MECRGSCYDVGVQTAKGFRNSPRGRTFKHRRGRGRYGFSIKNAQAALATYAPNIWEELHGLADGLEIPFETAVMRYSNGRLAYPTYGCSSLSTVDLFGRNYDYSVGKYNSMLLAIQPKGVNASVGFSDRFTGRVDGMNEHGALRRLAPGQSIEIVAAGLGLHFDCPHRARPVRYDCGSGQNAETAPTRSFLQLLAQGRQRGGSRRGGIALRGRGP